MSFGIEIDGKPLTGVSAMNVVAVGSVQTAWSSTGYSAGATIDTPVLPDAKDPLNHHFLIRPFFSCSTAFACVVASSAYKISFATSEPAEVKYILVINAKHLVTSGYGVAVYDESNTNLVLSSHRNIIFARESGSFVRNVSDFSEYSHAHSIGSAPYTFSPQNSETFIYSAGDKLYSLTLAFKTTPTHLVSKALLFGPTPPSWAGNLFSGYNRPYLLTDGP